MIPRDYITEWRKQAPWIQDFQVEQDLIISRALVRQARAQEAQQVLAHSVCDLIQPLPVALGHRYVVITPDSMRLLFGDKAGWAGKKGHPAPGPARLSAITF